MDGAGARIVEDLVAGLQHRHRDAAAGEVERGGEADRAGAGDQHAVGADDSEPLDWCLGHGLE